MTDNEIIKDLEECIELRFDDTEYATVRLDTLANALNLINRQKAEIDRLKPLEENLDKLLYMLNAVELGNSVLEEQKHQIKAEAIKEFAERLKENLIGWDTDPTDEEIEYTINNLVKEMVGKANP